MFGNVDVHVKTELYARCRFFVWYAANIPPVNILYNMYHTIYITWKVMMVIAGDPDILLNITRSAKPS